MEKNANDDIKKLRENLIDALKKKYEGLRDAELAVYDKQIEAKQRELKRLQDGYVDEADKLRKLEEEYKAWERDNSAYGERKRKEIQEQIDETKLNIDIENLEKAKEKVNKDYDKKLDERNLYNEADNMIKNNDYINSVELLAQYGEDFKDQAMLTGEGILSLVKSAVLSVQGAMAYVTGKSDEYEPNVDTRYGADNYWYGQSYGEYFGSGKGNENNLSNGRVKILDSSAMFYVDPYGNPSGKLQDAGVYWNDTMYITGFSNGKSAIAKSPNGTPMGYVDTKYLQKFETGGYTGNVGNNGALALLHDKELVLNKDQTKAMIDIAPYLKNYQKYIELQNRWANNSVNGYNSRTIEPPKQDVKIENNVNITHTGSNFDDMKTQNTLDKMFKKAMRESGMINK